MKPQGTFSFEANQRGIRYQRTDTPEGIRLNREGDLSLQVLWRKRLQCTGPIAAPVSVVFINLGDAPSVDLAVGDQHVLLPIALSGSTSRYSGSGVELWDHQGKTRISWFGQNLACTNQ